MSDFMKWLYPRYIRPYLDAVPQADYSFHFELVENELGQHAVESYEKIQEFTAIHAFLLGPFTSTRRMGNLIENTVPLIYVGRGVCGTPDPHKDGPGPRKPAFHLW